MATSVTSARVGRRAVTIEASIWVAVIEGLENLPAALISRFCSTGTCSSGSSIPRSPRATMIPPVAARTISSALAAASCFSILAISGMSESSSLSRAATGARSAALETKETASMSTPWLTANSTQPRSPSVAAGSAVAPGTFMPLWEDSVPPTSTSHSTSPSSGSRTRRRIAPSAR